MKDWNQFLHTLAKEGKIKLVDPSEEIKESYLHKAQNCLTSAKILFQHQLYENATSEAYYCMYNSLMSLLYKVGIKSENHSASILLLKLLFKEPDLFQIISEAKQERIDKQYNVESEQNTSITKESCNTLILQSEDFIVKIKVCINAINNKKISTLCNEFDQLTRKEREQKTGKSVLTDDDHKSTEDAEEDLKSGRTERL